MALVYAAPGIARAHILRAAGASSWRATCSTGGIPQSGRGVRTRISDDLLWLPVRRRPLRPRSPATRRCSTSRCRSSDAPRSRPTSTRSTTCRRLSRRDGTLYEHCLRALGRPAPRGAHGLPLMGTGDWNDGMNRVGVEGKGESVWLGLVPGRDAARVRRRWPRGAATRRGGRASRRRREALRRRRREHAWDGEWYRRAYFDDGTPLGSARTRSARSTRSPRPGA